MKRFSGFVVVAVLFALAGVISCGGGTGLRSSVQKGYGPFSAKIPYLNNVNYFGYVGPGVAPDGKHNGKDAFYLYFWVPAVIDEVGVAMVSPADGIRPGSGDFKHPKFDEMNQKDPNAYFDTWIRLERMDIVSVDGIRKGGRAISTLAENDDTGELKAQPSGSHYNSLVRVRTEAGNPLKALVRGVYRITFTSFRGEINGSYVATVGTNIPGVKIAASLNELHRLVSGDEKK